MNIGIFDTEHFETTYTVAKLFNLPGNSITIFTDEHCKQRFLEYPGTNENNYRWFIKSQRESHADFITRYGKSLKSSGINLLFYTTISNNHLLHALVLKKNPKIRSILTVHGTNELMDRDISLDIKASAQNFSKLILLKSVKELNVLSDTMTPLLNEKTGKKYIIHNIPGGVFEPPAPSIALDKKIRIVVPGTIDKSRKDYLEAIEFVINADAANITIEMVFLGAPYEKYGQNILSTVRKIKLKTSSIKTYPAEVSQQVFENELSEAHFIFLPCVRVSHRSGVAKEIYGETKITGGMFDAVRHARPLIIPTFMQMPLNMEKACLRYRDATHLLSNIRELQTKPAVYEKWQQNAREMAEHFSVENIRASHPTLFNHSR